MDIREIAEDYLVDPTEGLKAVLTWLLNYVMILEVEQQAGAKPYERTDGRKAHRNGFVKRNLITKLGEITLDKPRLREKSFETVIFERYSRVERAIIIAIAESYVQGVSTRRIKRVMDKFGIHNISASRVSEFAKELDENVHEFLNRPIGEKIRYIFVDASYIKIRENHIYINKALMIVVGIREDGFREILGAKIADSEDDLFWTDFFDELKARGLDGVRLVISDGHNGIQKAVRSSFLGASWQMCRVHFIRAFLKKVPKSERVELAEKLKLALDDPKKMDDLILELSQRGRVGALNTIDKFSADINNYKAFPESHWRRIRTTNIVERINKEVKRRTKEVGAFPDERSVLRLSGSILMDINEEWITGNKYLNMEEDNPTCPEVQG